MSAARRSLHRAARVTTIGLLLLLAAGAAVNSLGAALSVPDWPTSYGRILPFNFTGNAVHEQSHRILAVVCALLMVWLATAVARFEDRRWVRAIGFSAVALYFAQTLLGGLVVLWFSPGWLGALHTTLAQVSFVLVFLVVMATSGRWVEGGSGGEPLPAVRLVGAIAHLAFLQIVLGAASRHPPAGQGTFVVTLLAHFAIGLTLLGLAVALVVSLARQGAPRGMRSTARTLLILMLLQLAIAIPLLIVAPEPYADEYAAHRSFSYLHISHVLVAALVFAHAAALAVQVQRRAA